MTNLTEDQKIIIKAIELGFPTPKAPEDQCKLFELFFSEAIKAAECSEIDPSHVFSFQVKLIRMAESGEFVLPASDAQLGKFLIAMTDNPATAEFCLGAMTPYSVKIEMRKSWPFKDLEVGQSCRIGGTKSERTNAQIQAHTYAKATGKKMRTFTVDGFLFVKRQW